jgi:hypothetical protein
MHHRAEKIRDLWEAAAQRGEWIGSDVLEILTETRKLLENRNLRQTHPLLYLYCDWSLHDSIHRSDMARRVLRTFCDHLVPLNDENATPPHPDAKSPQDYFQKSLATMGPAALRKEWLALHLDFSIDARQLNSPQHWYPLYMMILSRLHGTPIQLAVTLENNRLVGLKPNVTLYEEMLARTGGNHKLIPRRIEVRPGRDCPRHAELLQAVRTGGDIRQTLELMGTHACWVVQTIPDIEIWILILPDEPASAFAQP